MYYTVKGLLYEDLSRKKELFKKRKKEYIKLARSTKIVGNNIQLKKEKSIKKRRAEKEKWYWVTEMNRAASGNRYSSDVHVSRSIRTEDNFIVLYRVREICREFILGQLSQREFYDSNVYFFFFFLLDSRGQLFELNLQTAKENVCFTNCNFNYSGSGKYLHTLWNIFIHVVFLL